MLPNYDAKAVAETMGLAFVRGAQAESAQDGFVIRTEDAALLMVEITVSDALAPFEKSSSFSTRRSEFASKRVESPSHVLIEKAVESGLPRKALRHVAQWIAGDDRSKVAALEWGVVPKTTLERREVRLSPQESERTERVARLFVHARRALGSEAEAREFLTTAHPELDGRSPIDMARTDLGTRRAEQILNALEYGLAL